MLRESQRAWIVSGEMEATCTRLEAEARAARLPPLYRQQLQDLAQHFGAKRDEIEQRMRPQLGAAAESGCFVCEAAKLPGIEPG